MDPGVTTIPRIARYSWWTACGPSRFATLRLGRLIVPLGTLMVTTGLYRPQTAGTGVVGMPTLTGNGYSLNQTTRAFSRAHVSASAVPNLVYYDLFAWNAA